MDNSAPAPIASPESLRSRKGGPDTANSLAAVNSALVGVGSVYLTTHSILVTLMAAVSAVILGGLPCLPISAAQARCRCENPSRSISHPSHQLD